MSKRNNDFSIFYNSNGWLEKFQSLIFRIGNIKLSNFENSWGWFQKFKKFNTFPIRKIKRFKLLKRSPWVFTSFKSSFKPFKSLILNCFPNSGSRNGIGDFLSLKSLFSPIRNIKLLKLLKPSPRVSKVLEVQY
jgi:hypothetical protein